MAVKLTPHQIRVLKGLAVGKSIKEIAFDLNVSNKTIEYHWARLSKRINVKNYVELTHYALAYNIVTPLFKNT